jgi:hypothetical protein
MGLGTAQDRDLDLDMGRDTPLGTGTGQDQCLIARRRRQHQATIKQRLFPSLLNPRFSTPPRARIARGIFLAIFFPKSAINWVFTDFFAFVISQFRDYFILMLKYRKSTQVI